MNKYTLIIFLFSPICLYGQDSTELDTIEIYKNKSAIGIKKYYKTWFLSNSKTCNIKSYSYSLKKISEQDSVVLIDTLNKYFKLYDKKNRLILEGERPQGYSELKGDIIFYYKNGKVKRVEHWNNEHKIDTCNYTFQMNDAFGPEKTWRYYRRDGSLKKTVNYYLTIDSCSTEKTCVIKKISRFNGNNKLIYEKKKKNCQ